MISKIIRFFVFSFVGVQSLSKISIGLKPYQYQYVDPNYNQPNVPQEDFSFRISENMDNLQIPAEWEATTLSSESRFVNSASEWEAASPAFKTLSIENTATIAVEEVKPIIPKKRKTKRKPRKKPKKMHLRRVFKTRLITTTPRPIIIEENRIEEETTTNVINLAPIYDAESGQTYSQEELNKICLETVSVSRGFGISDIEGFAKNNCFLIRLYYPNVSCSQINQLVGYCTENGLMNG